MGMRIAVVPEELFTENPIVKVRERNRSKRFPAIIVSYFADPFGDQEDFAGGVPSGAISRTANVTTSIFTVYVFSRDPHFSR
jgi:hypothetical protein